MPAHHNGGLVDSSQNSPAVRSDGFLGTLGSGVVAGGGGASVADSAPPGAWPAQAATPQGSSATTPAQANMVANAGGTPVAATTATVAAQFQMQAEQLIAMGFTADQARQALAATGGDVEAAADWLIS